MAKSNGNGWNWSESLAERMRMQKNGNAVRWYVLTLPVSRRGHYQGEPARGLKAELDRRTRTGEPTFEYFAPSYIEVRKRRGELVTRAARCSTTTSSCTPRRLKSTG